MEQTPSPTPDDSTNSEAELERFARWIYSRRSGIALADLDNWFEVNPSELDELDRIKDSLRNPATWLDGGVKVFDVTESPEGEIQHGGRRYAIVRSYGFNYVPNRPRRTSVFPWALNYGQNRS